MKKIELNRSRLQFNKERVATLTTPEMRIVQGGIAPNSSPMLCFPNTYDVTLCCTGNTCTSPSTDACGPDTEITCIGCTGGTIC